MLRLVFSARRWPEACGWSSSLPLALSPSLLGSCSAPNAPCSHFRTSTSARRPWRRMPPSCWLCWASGTSTALGVRRMPCCPTTSTCTALLPTSSRYQLPGHALGWGACEPGCPGSCSSSGLFLHYPWACPRPTCAPHLMENLRNQDLCQLSLATVGGA